MYFNSFPSLYNYSLGDKLSYGVLHISVLNDKNLLLFLKIHDFIAIMPRPHAYWYMSFFILYFVFNDKQLR